MYARQHKYSPVQWRVLSTQLIILLTMLVWHRQVERILTDSLHAHDEGFPPRTWP